MRRQSESNINNAQTMTHHIFDAPPPLIGDILKDINYVVTAHLIQSKHHDCPVPTTCLLFNQSSYFSSWAV